jgi:hypothetical protein
MLSRLFRAGPAPMVLPVLSAPVHWLPLTASLVSPLASSASCTPPGRHGHEKPYPARQAMLMSAAQTRRNGN